MKISKNNPVEEVFLTEEILDDNHVLKKILQIVGARKIVLDVGCSYGYLAKMLEKRECVVTGIDINADAAKIAEKYCDRVQVVDLDIVDLKDLFSQSQFDVVIFGDILEHLKYPHRILESTREILKEGGYAIASIPNVAHGAVRLALLQGKFEYTPLGILDRTHLRFFTRKTIEELFEKAGYTIEFIDTTKLDIFSASSLLPSFDSDRVSASLLNQIKKDPDADTCQFLIKASPLPLQKREGLLGEKLEKTVQELENLKSIFKELENSKTWKLFNFFKKFKQKIGL